MSLEQAIRHGKEKRRPNLWNRGRGRWRPRYEHAECDYCISNRTHSLNKRRLSANEEITEWLNGYPDPVPWPEHYWQAMDEYHEEWEAADVDKEWNKRRLTTSPLNLLGEALAFP
mgnify:CR=1 FL=1